VLTTETPSVLERCDRHPCPCLRNWELPDCSGQRRKGRWTKILKNGCNFVILQF